MDRDQQWNFGLAGEAAARIGDVLVDAAGRELVGRVAEIHLGGHDHVCLDLVEHPGLATGDRVTMAFSFPGRHHPIQVQGQVTEGAEPGDDRRVEIQLALSVAGRRALASGVYGVLNRREIYRVRTDLCGEVRVTLPELGVCGRLRDISFGSAAVQLPAEALERIAPEQLRLAVELQLPGGAADVVLETAICRRSRQAGGLLVGLAFAEPQTPEERARRGPLQEFVMARQRDELKRRRGSGA